MIEFADDLAAFFNPEEFGEAVAYLPRGADEALPIGAIWSRPGSFGSFGRGETALDKHRFVFLAAGIPAPKRGATITLSGTAEQFSICEDPTLSTDGALWTVLAAEA